MFWKSFNEIYFFAVGIYVFVIIAGLPSSRFFAIPDLLSDDMIPLSTLSEQELVALFKKEDEGAYTEIYYRYKGVLHLHAYKKLGNFEEARDALQELFTRFWNNREQIIDHLQFIRIPRTHYIR